jgi:hypothetical protein
MATQGGLPYQYGALPHHVCIEAFASASGGLFETLAQYFFGGVPTEALGDAVATGRAQAQAAGYTCGPVPACVPISVPIMEGFTAFGLLRTGMLLAPPRWFQPFMVALVAVTIDWILDPTSAVSEWCGSGSGLPIKAAGIEFWHWFVWGQYEPNWHGIPLINFGAWYFGTVGIAMAALAVIRYRTGLAASVIADIASIIVLLLFVLLLGLHLEKLAFAWMGALFDSYSSAGQWGFIIAWGVGTAALVVYFAGSFQRGHSFRWEWLPIPALMLVSSLMGLIIAGPHALPSLLYLAWGLILAVVAAYLLWPYRP